MSKTITVIPTLPKPEGKKRVAAYARVSSGKDAMLHSLSAQVSHYSQFIQSHCDWIYVGVYADEAKTGTKDSRENFQRLIADCRAGKINMVITKSVSRFARNTVTLLKTVRDFKAWEVDIFFEEQNIHTMSADGELMLTILASYAQEESRSANENQKWRVRKGFENGELMNLRFLFGYDISADGITVNEEEAAVVREIFTRFNSGESMNSISRDIVDRGITGSLGGKWCPGRIRDTLSNEKYLGNALLQKKYRNNHIEKKLMPNNGELPKYYAEDTHEAIIDRETFDKAQERLAILAQQTSKRKNRTNSVFSGLVRCGLCGNTYKRTTHKDRHFLSCTTYEKHGKSACAAKRIPEETLISLTCEILKIDKLDSDTLRSRITAIRIEQNNTVVFGLDDGSEIKKQWKDRSRSESWTDEMKEAARQKALERSKHNA